MNDQTTIFVVDDDAAVRDSLSLLLRHKGHAVEACDGAEAFFAAWRPERRGCIILDVRMPGMSGPEFQEELARRKIGLPIIFLTGYGDIPATVRAMKSGAIDFLTKPVTAADLLKSVQAALLESERLAAQAETSRMAAAHLASLTERERDVLALAVEGLPNKEIARRLDISYRTVEIHKAHIMDKTGAANVLDLARMVAEAGLSPPSDAAKKAAS